MDQRDAVRGFLSSRRALLRPVDVGLPPGIGLRRVAGLRRDEVAVLAGVSSEYYARIERGDLAGVSVSVLEAIATALRLDADEREHLLNLARAAEGPARDRPHRGHRAAIRASLQRVIDEMDVNPAYVRNANLDVVAGNRMARELYRLAYRSGGDAAPGPNLARFVFLDPSARTFFPAWDQISRNCVAALHVAAGRDPADAALARLVGELSTRSESFRMLWAAQDVHLRHSGRKSFLHPDVGVLDLDFDLMELAQEPGLVCVVYSAEPGSSGADGLRMLASLAATRDIASASLEHPGRE